MPLKKPEDAQREILDAIIDIGSDLLKLEAGEQVKVLKQLKKLEKDLIDSLRKINPIESKTAKAREKRVRQAIAQSKIISDKYYREIKKGQQQTLEEVARFQDRAIAREINDALGVITIDRLLSANKIKALVNDEIVIGEKLNEFWSRQSAETVKAYRNEIRQGIISGDTFNQIERRIRGTRKMNYRDGIMNVRNNQARTYIRTSMQNVSNSARMETYKQNTDVISMIEWSATLDLRTSVICISLDGKRWSNPDYKPVGHSFTYPGAIAHPNCRSTQIPVVKGYEDYEGKKASAVGQVSSKTKYEDWLKNPPEKILKKAGEQAEFGRPMTKTEFQDMKLGKWKAEQFRRGNLKINDLLAPRTKEGTVLTYTMNELKKKHGLKDYSD